MFAPPPPGRRLLAIAAGGVAAAALVVALGLAAERIVLGSDEAAFRNRIEEEVRSSFDAMARDLQVRTSHLTDPGRAAAAGAGDATAARALFDGAELVVNGSGAAELAATVYGTEGTPIAWAGRPSDLPSDRITGPESWFFIQGAMGLRLVYVAPVLDPGGHRVGSVTAERTLNEVVTREADGAFMYPTRFSRVAIEPMLEPPRNRADGAVFSVRAPGGGRLLTAVVAAADLARTRTRWRRATESLAIGVSALTVLLLCGPLIDWRNRARRRPTYAAAAAGLAAAVLAGRALLGFASPADWATGAVFSAAAYASPLLAPLLTSPFDFLLTALACGALVTVASLAVEAWRLAWRHRRVAVTTPGRRAGYACVHLAAGLAVAFVLAGQVALIRDTIANATIDLLHFSLHPWNTARVALQAGIVIWSAAALALAVALLRAATVPWCVRRYDARRLTVTALLWALPLLVWLFAVRGRLAAERPLWIALAVAVMFGMLASRLKARYRHGSQAFRLVMLTAGLVAPTLAFYPSLFQTARESKIELVESRYAPQALNQRRTIQQILEASLAQIDAFPLLNDLVSATVDADDVESVTDRGFQVWRGTGLANYPVTSSVELFGPDGRLVSRFAFNLPDDLSAVARFVDRSCEWDIFEEVSPFFAEERRVLHAGRAACATAPDGTVRVVGAIVVHAMLDYANLPFIASQNPYLEMLRPADLQDESRSGGDIDYAVYGWSRRPIYTSGDTAWQLDDETFQRVAASRDARWAQLRRGDEPYDVFLTNDRFGIYALGFPVVTALGHLVNIAELTVLAAGTCAVLLALNLVFAWLSRRQTSGRALLREVRASFYRKLFLAFVMASVVPVVALAIVARNYVAAEMDAAVEDEAVRTAAAARRVVEDLVAPRAAEQGVGIDDNLMVWVSRLIDQDVNIFRGARLQATSERNLFASGLLPSRTPAAVYRDLMLRNEAATVSRERLGTFEYLVAGSPVKARQVDAILTVPLTARQREIEEQVDLLNRQVLLGALLCILAGAIIGYSLAERIADPVNRLTRATRRVARGELDVRVAATSSDELRRLVQDFNRMAHELQQQRRELERTHRLEAWAEMSRQVAHDIKNPLTPIQLNAEHLRRVHADRGEPLSPVLEECVANILAQVTLLRQIASEFSSFAASPTVRRAAVDLAGLLDEIVGPYRMALAEKVRFEFLVSGDLPHVDIDRALVARALTNVIENALHAMPAGGTLTIAARVDDAFVRIRVSDTGRGMDPEALARAFEPYFSTKATGTGLGLPIAKRNVELNGGHIAITTGSSGTTVEVVLPLAERPTYSALR